MVAVRLVQLAIDQMFKHGAQEVSGLRTALLMSGRARNGI